MDPQRAQRAGTSSASSAADEYFPVRVIGFNPDIVMPSDFERSDSLVGQRGIIVGEWNSGGIHMLFIEHEHGTHLHYHPTELEEDHTPESREFWIRYLNDFPSTRRVWKYGWEVLDRELAK